MPTDKTCKITDCGKPPMRALKKRSLSLDAVAAHVGRVVEVHDLRVNIKENARG